MCLACSEIQRVALSVWYKNTLRFQRQHKLSYFTLTVFLCHWLHTEFPVTAPHTPPTQPTTRWIETPCAAFRIYLWLRIRLMNESFLLLLIECSQFGLWPLISCLLRWNTDASELWTTCSIITSESAERDEEYWWLLWFGLEPDWRLPVARNQKLYALVQLNSRKWFQWAAM